jgi:hypothetical protein
MDNMLKTFRETTEMIRQGKLLHIAGVESLLRDLPAGNWIGGSTGRFMGVGRGEERVIGPLLEVRELPFEKYKILSYDEENLPNLTRDAYKNGFSIVILPYRRDLSGRYAKNASGIVDGFLPNVIGWVSGADTTPVREKAITINGRTDDIFSEKAVAVHVALPVGKRAGVVVANLFEPDRSKPAVSFANDGDNVESCFINGSETLFAEYLLQNDIDISAPLIGDYAGREVNVSFRDVQKNRVQFFAPVFRGVNYNFAKNASSRVPAHYRQGDGVIFACDDILNLVFTRSRGINAGGLSDRAAGDEIACRVMNQTLLCLTMI